MVFNCLVVDDEELSRDVVRHYIEKTKFLTLKGEAKSGKEALSLLNSDDSDIDIIFLDIQMPEMSGMEMLNHLRQSYEIIILSSADNYAVEAFEKQITDYLVKPYEYSRFLSAAVKARENIEDLIKDNEKEKDIFVKSDSKWVRIPFEKILFIEALADYVIFNTAEKKFIVHYTMKGIEKKLPISLFTRVHRSYIVNVRNIELIEDLQIKVNGKSIPIGASYKESFFGKLNLL